MSEYEHEPDDDEDEEVSEATTRDRWRFLPRQLDRTVIAIPLLDVLREEERGLREPEPHAIVMELNLEHSATRAKTRAQATDLVSESLRDEDERQGWEGRDHTDQYLFARLWGATIREIVARNEDLGRPIYRIWPDFEIGPLVNKSISTVKADAAHISFSALGSDVVWAVIDSGIHPHRHFKKHGNLLEDDALKHRDFTGDGQPLVDGHGHGTHVAGILAGELKAKDITAVTRFRDEKGKITARALTKIEQMTGMAPACRLLSLKVLDAKGRGDASNIINAIDYVQQLNGYGRHIRIHGVNLSVGYGFEPEWFACGQSPLCIEVDQLVKSGVVVVVAAGNTGYGYVRSKIQGPPTAGLGVTINDPGNADRAITVGATHRDMPHVYGVSYFSSKGPTGDGRDKPDLVAPGEKILSCAAGKYLDNNIKYVGGEVEPDYVEDSGTSMAAPHVSGVIAGFLSIRQEFIGQPDRIKEIFVSTATDLRRDKHFQGRGLVDAMRAIQSV